MQSHMPLTVDTVFCTNNLLKGVIRLGADFHRFRKACRTSGEERMFRSGGFRPLDSWLSLWWQIRGH
jgi:hypothetical protein